MSNGIKEGEEYLHAGAMPQDLANGLRNSQDDNNKPDKTIAQTKSVYPHNYRELGI